MKNIVLYGHGGSYNHGCEALVRTTVKILRENFKEANIILYSINPESDYKWHVNEIVDEIRKMPDASFFARISRKVKSLFKMNSNDINDSIAKQFVNSLKDIDLAVSIGGDNYCYSKDLNYLFYKINELLNEKNIKTIFWGCSIEEKFIDDAMIKDLEKYSLVTVRETLTKENLEKNGVINNVKLIPDGAFILDSKEIDFRKDEKNDIVGINISPMIIDYEKENNITYKNYTNLIKNILDNTNYSIYLISHVVDDIKKGDLAVNERLYNDFKEYSDRIFVVPEMSAENIKNVISKCKMFIGARTHSTIAAYSTCVPTLVVGYSVKAKGIAIELFGTYDNYVIPVQSLKNEYDLVKAFNFLNDNKEEIKNKLESLIPDYKSKVEELYTILKEI